MKIYILASFKMDPDSKRIKDLVDWLNTGLKQVAEDGHFLNVTSSDVSFLNDARRVVRDAAPMIPFNVCPICNPKNSRKPKPRKKEA